MLGGKGVEKNLLKRKFQSGISRLSKVRIIIFIVIVSVVIASIVVTKDVIAEKSSIDNSLLASRYALPNAIESVQEKTIGDTTVRLIYVIPSATETLIELEVLDPTITEGARGTLFMAPRSNINLIMYGFQTNEILGSPEIKVMQGSQRILLNLSPLENVYAEATIELKDIQKHNPATGELTTIAGSWRFTFTPKVQAEQLSLRDFDIAQYRQINNIRIRLQRGRISATETLIYSQIEMPEGVPEYLGQASLEFDEKILGETNRYKVEDSVVFSFPPVPADVDMVAVVFAPTISSDGPAVQVTIPLSDYQKQLSASQSSINIDQVVNINGEKLRFTKLTQHDGFFTLQYEPAYITEYGGLLLAGQGPLTDILTIMDDKGNTYPGRGAGTVFDATEGHRLKRQLINFTGYLDQEASELSMTAQSTAVITGPFEFEFTIKQ